MIPAPIPSNEEARLRSLDEYQLIELLPEEIYDEITQIAAEICGTPVALINIIGKDFQYTKSRYGMKLDVEPREYSFCGHAINNPDQVMVVPDARFDKRFNDNPLVTGQESIIFYAGVPLQDDNGNALGSLCVIDHRPRELSEIKIEALKSLAKLVKTHFEMRKVKLHLKRVLENFNAAQVLAIKLNNSVERLEPLVSYEGKGELETFRQTIDSLNILLNKA